MPHTLMSLCPTTALWYRKKHDKKVTWFDSLPLNGTWADLKKFTASCAATPPPRKRLFYTLISYPDLLKLLFRQMCSLISPDLGHSQDCVGTYSVCLFDISLFPPVSFTTCLFNHSNWYITSMTSHYSQDGPCPNWIHLCRGAGPSKLKNVIATNTT